MNRQGKTQRDLLRGRPLSNLFFEDSTRTRISFEIAGKRLGADIVNKCETLLDTARPVEMGATPRDAARPATPATAQHLKRWDTLFQVTKSLG